MKASEVLKEYAAGKRNFHSENLRSQSFQGQDLSGADFSNAELYGTNFTGATLEGTIFCGAKCGLQKRCLTFLVIRSCCIAGMSGIGPLVSSPFILMIFDSNFNNQDVGLVGLILLFFFLILLIPQEIIARIVLVGAASAVLGVLVPGAFKGTGTASVVMGVAIALAFVVSAVAVSVLLARALVVAVLAAGTPAGALVVITILLGVVILARILGEEAEVVVVFAVPVLSALVGVLAGIYIGFHAMGREEKYTWVRSVAIDFASMGGTRFCGATLTNANFTKAILKSTDFTKATITGVRWYDAKKLEYVRCSEETYLKNELLRQLLITNEGQNKNFDRLDLRGLNLEEAKLERASFIDTDLSEANLKEAKLYGAKLVKTNLERADLTGAKLTGVCIQDWDVTRSTKLNGVECEYVFMKYIDKDKRDRMPPKENFKNGEFIFFIRSILDTLDLYHGRDVNPRAAVIVLKSLAEEFQESLEIVALERRGNGIILKLKTSEFANQEQLKEEYYARYSQTLTLSLTDPNKQLPKYEVLEAKLTEWVEEVKQHTTNSFKYVYNETLMATGNINMFGDRNIEIKQGNYTEKVEGNKTDQSRKVEISGGTVYASGAGVFNLGDISGTVANSINQIPSLYDPNQLNIKQLLSQLKESIEAEPNLENIDKYDALEELNNLAQVSQDKEESKQKNKAGKSLRILHRIAKALPAGAALVTICKEILPAIANFFGL